MYEILTQEMEFWAGRKDGFRCNGSLEGTERWKDADGIVEVREVKYYVNSKVVQLLRDSSNMVTIKVNNKKRNLEKLLEVNEDINLMELEGGKIGDIVETNAKVLEDIARKKA